MLENLIFLSYRRADSAPHALALKLELEDRFRAAQVFVDTHHIRGADRWANEIEVALRAAKVVIPIIGPEWTGQADGGRRIDDPDDWVRKEVELSLAGKADAVLPVLVGGAKMPSADELPPSCRALADIQAVPIDLSNWHATADVLVQTLADRFGYARKQSGWRYPTPDPVVAKTIPFGWDELERLVREHLPEWSLEFSDDEQHRHHKRIELTKAFGFGSFSRAVDFMNIATSHARQVQHHPRLMNVWWTVKVWLTTFDAGHRVTALDIEFARYLDREFRKMTSGAS